MTYVDQRYINRVWESEMRHHERTIAQLRIKLEKLIKELSWELDQHHSRLKELQRLDGAKGRDTLHRHASPTLYTSSSQLHRIDRVSSPSSSLRPEPELVK